MKRSLQHMHTRGNPLRNHFFIHELEVHTFVFENIVEFKSLPDQKLNLPLKISSTPLGRSYTIIYIFFTRNILHIYNINSTHAMLMEFLPNPTV